LEALVDADEVPGNLQNAERDLKEAIQLRITADQTAPSSERASQQEVQPQGAAEEDLPEKYRGKSLREVIEMHRNAESRLGQISNDLGVQRKMTDRLLDIKRTTDLEQNGAVVKVPQVTSAELLEKPTETLERFTNATSERVESKLIQELNSVRGELGQMRFNQRHSDATQIANDPQFVDWVTKSPYRTRAAQAAYAGDWVAADELLTEYKATRPDTSSNDTKQATQKASLQAARAASLESSSSSDKSTTGKSGKILRRADLITLRVTDPDTYYSDDYQREIMLAYAENRVK
jgi:hypothetical protein